MKIIIAGDICPVTRVGEYMSINYLAFIDNPIRKLLKDNYAVANLEGAITDCIGGIEKVGPHRKGNPSVTRALVSLGIDSVILANNHVGDYGKAGILDTLMYLEQHNISSFGAGVSLSEARKPIIIDCDEIQVGLYGVAGSEFGLATKSKAGVNGLDLFNLVADVQQLVRDADCVIVAVHLGITGFQLPSPFQRKLCRHLIDLGVNMVVCQHSHAAGAWESYKHGFISYGQGNFLFDWYTNNYVWSHGYLLCVNPLKLVNGGKEGVEVLPYSQFYRSSSVRALTDSQRVEFENKIEHYNRIVESDTALENAWNEYVSASSFQYASRFLGLGKVGRAVAKLVPWPRLYLSRRRKLRVAHSLSYEDYYEAIKTMMKI